MTPHEGSPKILPEEGVWIKIVGRALALTGCPQVKVNQKFDQISHATRFWVASQLLVGD